MGNREQFPRKLEKSDNNQREVLSGWGKICETVHALEQPGTIQELIDNFWHTKQAVVANSKILKTRTGIRSLRDSPNELSTKVNGKFLTLEYAYNEEAVKYRFAVSYGDDCQAEFDCTSVESLTAEQIAAHWKDILAVFNTAT